MPEDYVIATGEQHSVREFVEITGKELGISVCWEGQGVDEKGIDEQTGKVIVAVDPRYFRPTEVDTLLGDYSKAREKLGRKPRRTFNELVSEMVGADLEEAKRDDLMQKEGYRAFNHFE